MNTSIGYLNRNELNAILRETNNIRDHAIIALLINTGITLGELMNLKTDSIDWETKMLLISGRRERKIRLNDQAYDALAKWSRERADSPLPALFITNRGKIKALSARSVEHHIKKYGEQAGIRKRATANILRNTFAVRLFAEQAPKEKAAAMLGISYKKSIDRYATASKLPPKADPEFEAAAKGRAEVKLDEAQKAEADALARERSASQAIARIDTRPFGLKIISRYWPAAPKSAKPANETNAPGLPSLKEQVFGRESAIEEIRLLLAKNQPVLLTGPLGIGKSHILKNISRMLAPGALYISAPIPLKNMLNQIGEKLNPEFKQQAKGNGSAKELADLIVRERGARPQGPVLIIDNLNALRASDADLFGALLENFTVLGAAEELNPKLKQVWWKLKQIKINPLSREAAKELIKYLARDLAITNYEMLETRIANMANGYPLAIADMMGQISHKPVITREIAREDYHEAGTRYRDWTPFLIVLWGAAMIYRFVALGTHSFEGYIIAGTLIAALMTVIRFMRMVK